MASSILRSLPGVLALLAGTACGSNDPPPTSSADELCTTAAATAAAAQPPGVQPGEPYRWLARTWRSPLGLTIKTYGVAVDGIAVYDRRQVEIYDARGALVSRAGSGDAVLAQLRARRAAGARLGRHPRATLGLRSAPAHPLVHTTQRPAWRERGGELVPVVMTERLALIGDTPLGELTMTDAVTGAVLERRPTLFELDDPAYLVYARDDGRPLTSPLGDTVPHPTGTPDGRVPAPVAQQQRHQRMAAAALADPWLPATASRSQGNNVVAFFDSLLDASGVLAEPFDADGNDTPEYGPAPDTAHGDFFAPVAGDGLVFPYDATQTAREYFQDGEPGTSPPPPDERDPALNAKIAQAFYAANWLHDYFYQAGFDELAGNAQQSNLGRGGVACDPLIVHAGFLSTFTFPGSEGVSPVLDMGLNARSASRRDSAMDFSVLAHEWGHYLIGRLAGGTSWTDGLGNMQGLALHEGIADFVGILVTIDGQDLHAAFPLGQYSNLDYIERRPTLPPEEAPADAMYYGIRRFPYSLDFQKNPLTLRHMAEPPPLPYYNWKGRGPLLSESHTTGEVFSQALFQCLGGIVAAHPGEAFESVRARAARYLVAGLVAFPEHPSLLDARDAFLDVIRLADPAVDYPACRAGFAARGMGAGAVGPDREFGGATGTDDNGDLLRYDPAQITESFVDGDHALQLVGSTFVPAASDAAGSGAVRVDLRNTGLVEQTAAIEVTSDVPAAIAFPDGARVEVGATGHEQGATATLAVVVDACRLPEDPAQPGNQIFAYTVTASTPAPGEVTVRATYQVTLPRPTSCPVP